MSFNYEQLLTQLLETVARQGASDLHFSVGASPTLRVDGSLVPIAKTKPLTPDDTLGLAEVLLEGTGRAEKIVHDQEIDFSYSFADKMRFRVNIFHQSGFVSVALRLIPSIIKTIDELNLPPVLHRFTKANQGFFLVVGPSGQGKTTTLAAMMDEINHTRAEHLITIEDPIEYLFIQDKSIIDQREVGRDTKDFHTALRSAFRQDPDVIMVGEMRDPETISAATTAAETGHLIFATLHTNNAAQTIDRIIDSFPAAQQAQVRSQLALTLLGVLSERLIPRIGGGRIPAVEFMVANSAIRNIIREKKVHELELVIETSADEGMISLNRSLADLVRRGEISMENAELYSLNSKELRILVE